MVKDANGNAILDAAATLFRRHGLGGTSIRGVADKAGVLPGSLTYRYPTKESLVLALMERAIADVSAKVIETLTTSADPLERLRFALRAHLAALLAEDDAMYVLLFEWPRLSLSSRRSLSRERRKYEALWDGLLYAAVGSNQIDPTVDLDFLRRSLLGAANSTAIWHSAGNSRSPDQIADAILAMFAFGIATDAARPTDLPTVREAFSVTVPSEGPHRYLNRSTEKEFSDE